MDSGGVSAWIAVPLPCIAVAFPWIAVAFPWIAVGCHDSGRFPWIAVAFPWIAVALPWIAVALPCIAVALPCIAVAFCAPQHARKAACQAGFRAPGKITKSFLKSLFKSVFKSAASWGASPPAGSLPPARHPPLTATTTRVGNNQQKTVARRAEPSSLDLRCQALLVALPDHPQVPDTRRPGFAEECRRQSLSLRDHPHEREILDWIEAVADTEGWT